MSQLVKYEAALQAIAACKAIDEVKAWTDKAAAMQAYGRMAKDKTLEIDASEIRMRSERRLGEMISYQKLSDGLNAGAKGVGKSVLVTNEGTPKLADLGISYDLSSRAQKLAAVPEEEFESEVKEWRQRVSIEGARVSARLEASGSKKIAEAENETIDYTGPSDDELAEALEMDANDKRILHGVLAGDDPLADALKEIIRLKSELAIVKLARDGYMNQFNEVLKKFKAVRRKLESMK